MDYLELKQKFLGKTVEECYDIRNELGLTFNIWVVGGHESDNSIWERFCSNGDILVETSDNGKVKNVPGMWME